MDGSGKEAEKLTNRHRYLLASLVWCLAALVVKPFYPYVDFGVFYSTAIERILAGTPLDIYAFVVRAPGTDLALPLSYSPVYFFFLAPWFALGRWLGISDFHGQGGFSLGQAWILLVNLPFDLLLCREILRWTERLRGALPEPRRWLLFVCLLFSPLLWLSSVRYGHNESILVLLTLWAIRHGEEEHPIGSGILWGLALSLKLTAAVPALTYFGWGMGRRRFRSTLVAVAAAGTIFVLPLVPYLIWRREQIAYALFGFESIRPVGGYVLWKIASFPEFIVQASGSATLIGAAGLGWLLSRRGSGRFLDAGGASALVLGQVLLLLLAKAVFVWYGLALGCFCYLAFAPGPTRRWSLPLGALGANLLIWLLQAGPWIGSAISPWIRFRSGMWVLYLSLLAYNTIPNIPVRRRDSPATSN